MKTITPTIPQLRMLSALKGETWMMRPDAVESFALSALEAGERVAEREDFYADFYNLRQAPSLDAEGIGHVHVAGALLSECPPIYEKLGLATRYKTIQQEADNLLDSGARGILFHINSPGGTVAGCAECAEHIAALTVPTMAYCDGLACSAAYKLASATGSIAASKSAEVGNIGSILSWADCDEFWKNIGVEFKALVSEGATLKSTFRLEPDDEQLAFLQGKIDGMGKAFRDFVAEHREKSGAVLDPEVWRAGWYSGDQAWSLGLVDAVATEGEAMAQFNAIIHGEERTN